jgi:hypothetical protein
MILTGENRSTRGRTSPIANCHTNLTCTASRLNSGLPNDRRETKRPNHGTTVKHKIQLLSHSKPSTSTLKTEIDWRCIQKYCSWEIKQKALPLTLPTWRIWWAPTNDSKWQTGFNSAFKGLNELINIGHIG